MTRSGGIEKVSIFAVAPLCLGVVLGLVGCDTGTTATTSTTTSTTTTTTASTALMLSSTAASVALGTNYQFSVTGGTAPYTFALTSGSLGTLSTGDVTTPNHGVVSESNIASGVAVYYIPPTSLSSSSNLTETLNVTDSAGNVVSGTITLSANADESFTGFFNNISANQTILGTKNITVHVYDGTGTTVSPASIQLILEETSGGTMTLGSVTVPPSNSFSGFSQTWPVDTTSFSNGSYKLHLNATDNYGNVYADIAVAVPVTIANADPVTAAYCAAANGISVLAHGVPICKVSGNDCGAHGMIPYGDGNWTTTAANTCSGGSTTNCSPSWAVGLKSGTTPHHDYFTDLAPEQISVPTLMACGTTGYSAYSGSVTCSATVTAIGCVAPPNG